MPKNWKKFNFQELVNIWVDHKRPSNDDPLRISMIQHKRTELTHEEIEELVDYLLYRWSEIKSQIDLEKF